MCGCLDKKSIEAWLANADPFRVVGVGHARPFPLKSKPCLQVFAHRYRDRVQPSIQPILQKHHIRFSSISLRRRYISDGVTPEDAGLHSLLISTRDESPTTWETAAKEMQSVFQNAGITANEIEIEIFNEQKLICNKSEVLPKDSHLVSAMIELKPRILDILISQCPRQWSSVAFHQRRPISNDKVRKMPTVLVSFFPETFLDFKSIESRLLEVLDQSPIPIGLELLRGLVASANINTESVVQWDFVKSTEPRNGSSIGITGDPKKAGSLGCWLDLSFPTSETRQVALTCHHVVALDGNDRRKQIGIAGADFGALSNRTTVECPAAVDRAASLTQFESSLPETKKALKTMKSIDSKPVIGHVIAASGLRTNAAFRSMDWALVEISVKHGKNKPPPASSFTKAGEMPSALGSKSGYKMTKDSVVRHIGEMKKDSWVAKTGRTSKATAGFVNEMKRIVNWEQYKDYCSEEVEVIGLGNDFAQLGDSGSMVTNSSGELVGILFARDSCVHDYDIGFVTSILDIFQDVKQQTGGVLSLN